MESKPSVLIDVAIIRPILILLLVFYHAFAIYSGGWAPIDGFPEVKVYWWLDKLSYAFMLEMFTFISGYVFGYQVRIKGEQKLEAKALFIGKLKRLIVPSIIFSFLYIVLFQGTSGMSIGQLLFGLIEGKGHMWYLPMLFWCFIGIYFIEKIRVKPIITVSLLFVLSIMPLPVIPLNIDHTIRFMFYFYLGYAIQRYNVDLKRYFKPPFIIAYSLLFLLFFPSLTILQTKIISKVGGGNIQIMDKLVGISLINLCKLIYALLGTAMLFGITNYYVKSRGSFSQWLIELGGLCMGVYLFQQFILKLLYDCTSLPTILGPYWLPWVGFIITLFLSVVLSWMLHRNRIGRLIIG